MASKLFQYLALLSGSLLPFLTGVNLGWASPYLHLMDMKNPADAPMKLSPDEQFWCSVMPLLGAPPGALLGALIVDRIGRKYLLLALGPISFACFMAIGFTHNIIILDLARFLMGSVEGVMFTALPMYYGEIADSRIRGIMSSSILVAACFGSFFITSVGSYLSIFLTSMICCSLPVFHALTFIWMPRSPYYLLKTGNLEGARRSLRMLRGTKEIDEEFSEILVAVKRQESVTQKRKAKYTDLFTEPGNRKAVIIYLVLCFANKFSGVNPILFYAHTIFHEARDFLKPEYSVMILMGSSIICVSIGMLIVDKCGRRPLMFSSTLGSTVALAFFAAYFTMQYCNLDIVKHLNWLPLVSLVSFISIYSVGISFGPVVLISELFPTSVKGYACGSGDALNVISATIVSKIFHGLNLVFGLYVPFWFFTGCGALGTILIYVYLPETKGKTLDEIQLELTGQAKSTNKLQEI